MGLLKKKDLWVLLIIIVVTSGLYSMNLYQQSRQEITGDSWEKPYMISPLKGHWQIDGGKSSEAAGIYREQLARVYKFDFDSLGDNEEMQHHHLREMRKTLEQTRAIIYYEHWYRLGSYYDYFIGDLLMYVSYGGELKEDYPINQHSFLVQVSSVFLGVIGLAILMIFFCDALNGEPERGKWLAIKEPALKFKLIASKYMAYILKTVAFILVVQGSGFIAPLIVKEKTIDLSYPQVLRMGEKFIIISTGEYLLRSILLFLCAGTIVFGISILMSKFVRKQVHLYLLVSVVVLLGYITTSIFQSPLNPFYLLNLSQVVNGFILLDGWLIVLSTAIWSALLLLLIVYTPEPKLQGVIA